MRCIKTGFVAEVASIRYYGDAFVLPMPDDIAQHAFNCGYTDEPKPGTEWLVLKFVSVRTAVEDWLTLGPVDHIRAETYEQCDHCSDQVGTLYLAPGTWQWLGYEGKEAKA